jgi:hypothetical protein
MVAISDIKPDLIGTPSVHSEVIVTVAGQPGKALINNTLPPSNCCISKVPARAAPDLTYALCNSSLSREANREAPKARGFGYQFMTFLEKCFEHFLRTVSNTNFKKLHRRELDILHHPAPGSAYCPSYLSRNVLELHSRRFFGY